MKQTTQVPLGSLERPKFEHGDTEMIQGGYDTRHVFYLHIFFGIQQTDQQFQLHSFITVLGVGRIDGTHGSLFLLKNV